MTGAMTVERCTIVVPYAEIVFSNIHLCLCNGCVLWSFWRFDQ